MPNIMIHPIYFPIGHGQEAFRMSGMFFNLPNQVWVDKSNDEQMKSAGPI